MIRHRIADNLSSDLLTLTNRFITYSLFRRIGLLFTTSFYVLQILLIVGNDFAKLGLLWGIAYFIEAIVGYPAGVIADKIGHRTILFIAYISCGIAYYLFSIATSFNMLIIILSLEALGYGLDSGILQSWFDNNYAVLSKDIDPERKIYSKIFARMSSTNDMIGLAVAILGGYIAVTIYDGRRLALTIQAIMMGILALIYLIGVKNFYETNKLRNQKENITILFFKGIWFVLRNPRIFVVSFGLVIDIVVETIWLIMLMVPVYYLYTGDEFYISLLMFAMFVISFFYLNKRSKNWIKVNPRKWLPIVFILQGLTFYGALYVLLSEFPGNNSFSIIGVIALFIIGSISTILLTLIRIFTYRLLLDSIPNEKRNAYYALLPTIATIIVAVLNYFSGMYIENNSFDLALIGLAGLRIIGGFFVFTAIAIFGLAKITTIQLYDEETFLIFGPTLDTLGSTFNKFKPTDWYIGETSKLVWLNLLEVAKKDGNVTEEELDLLTSVMIKINDYLEILEKVYEDEIITNEESEKLKKSRQKVLDMAREVAMRDNAISKDEEMIMKKLSGILIELEKVENIGRNK